MPEQGFTNGWRIMSAARIFGLELVGLASLFGLLICAATVARDRYLTHRRARRLRSGPSISLPSPRQERRHG